MSTASSVVNGFSSMHALRTARSSSHRRSSYRPSPTVDLAARFTAASPNDTCRFLGDPVLRSLRARTRNMDTMKVNDGFLPGVPPIQTDPSEPGSWKLWIVGIFFSVVVPFWANKWGPLQKLQQKVEEVVDTAQEVTDMVEDLAEKVEKVADEFGNSLPQGGKLQKAAQFVEDLADQTVKNVNLIEEVLDKVEAVENQVEEFLDEQMDETNKKDDKITASDVKPGTV